MVNINQFAGLSGKRFVRVLASRLKNQALEVSALDSQTPLLGTISNKAPNLSILISTFGIVSMVIN